jgi:ribosomal protein S18 acetylase RimI-like enzyme
MVSVLEACAYDAAAMSVVLEELVAAGKRSNRADADFVRTHYLEDPQRLHCFVAIDDREVLLGFQSLKRADAANPYGTQVGWGIIGTHIRPSSARSGVGSRLFAATIDGARKAGLPAIEAFIAEENEAALAYYEAMGFRTFRRPKGIICKVLRLGRS